MIEINLLPGQRKKKRAGVAFQMPDFKGLLTQVKDPLLLGFIGTFTVAALGVGFIYLTESRRLASMQEDLTRVEAEARRFQALINQKRKEERLRDSLVAELDAIRAIDSDRYVWPHILEEITKALPEFTWLQGVSVVSSNVTDTTAAKLVNVLIDGRAGDMGGYTRFLRQLGDSPWLTDVTAGATKTVLEDERPVLTFTISVTYRQADSAFIRTAPVLESVR